MSARWDDCFLRLAREMSRMSKDPSTQVGAVLVRGREVVAMGFNGFPPGVVDDERLDDREDKYRLVVHAEMNALLRAGGGARGCSLYLWPLPPCTSCAKHIVAAGVSEVVLSGAAPPVPSRWRADTEKAADLLREAGLTLRWSR